MKISIVMVSPFGFAHLRKAVAHLRRQTIAGEIELVLVAASREALDDARPGELAPFGRAVRVAAGPVTSVDRAAGQGVFHATAPVVAYLEDHAYPAPGWAEAMVAAHEGEWAVAASLMRNANPARLFSWVNLLGSFGWWAEGNTGGERTIVPGHNVSFKRAMLLEEGERLPERLKRDSGMYDDWARKRRRFYLCEAAAVDHVNASTLAATWMLRRNAGRHYAAHRAAREQWSWARRLLYVAGGPAIPLVRWPRVRRDWFQGGRQTALVPRIYPALATALVFDAIGQMLGYAFGAGRSLAALESYEMHLRRWVTPEEAAAMDGER